MSLSASVVPSSELQLHEDAARAKHRSPDVHVHCCPVHDCHVHVWSPADVLAAPHGRVLFAGEATSTNMATALGALLSGQREAARVIKLANAQ
jgi:hypothetical protein